MSETLRAEPDVATLLAVVDEVTPDRSGTVTGGRRLGRYPVPNDGH